jgi:hypothetical protein
MAVHLSWSASPERMISLPILGRDELWRLLIETVHSLPMYKSHKRYVEEVMITETPEISPQVLAVQLNITQGEAIVLLDEIRGQPVRDQSSSGYEKSTRSSADRSLLDFSN